MGVSPSPKQLMPIWLAKEELLSQLNKAYKKMDWVKGDIHITPYQDKGWLDYLLKTGFDSVVLH
jgi:hypothetical protein